MSTLRRRIVRANDHAVPPQRNRPKRITLLRSKLSQDRLALRRWMIRLKRAFHTVEKLQHRIARAERLLGLQEKT